MQMTAPRWKLALDKALAASPKATGTAGKEREDSCLNLLTVIQLASIDVNTPVPHVRSLVFRSFVSPTNDESHPLLLATTGGIDLLTAKETNWNVIDVRSPKTAQLISNPHVQVVWYIEGTQEQYRIAGTARVIPAPGEGLYKHFVHTLVELQNTAKPSSFDWEAKRLAVFRSMSPFMKASWCRPVPGSRLEGGQEEARKWPTEIHEPAADDAEAKKLWDMSLGNFALVVIEPSEVDHIELAPVPNLRTRYWRSNNGVWKDEELVP
ncbi:Pyridox-oxase-2 domain-containing protein [Mycena indigotica]|uniref:Pyridox-oxase-2 domain-containing protein n=1 Tax=Mycena indigotica TaxID=2126181 RepID=A0A8H6W7B7_9AGAR|nr:Pyridox-oxase-2 domain-containing protein [Mycena indigotica]KAF7307517.1 Pyridox-oxase-2 domain-containing protein [Mycena indigotica]